MKCSRLIAIGTLIMATIVPTQAAVYGTLTQDMQFNVNEADITYLASGQGISIIDEEEDNYLIRINESTSELISKNLVKTAGVVTRTKASDVTIFASADETSETLEALSYGELVMALEKDGDFYKVKVNDIVGYIQAWEVENAKLTNLVDVNEVLSKGEEIVEYAKQFLGGRYVYGGNNLRTGVDCSGFTQQIMKNFDISLSRSSRDQYASNGYKVTRADLQPGDLVFYGYNGSINHVAIYAGNNQIVHASTEKTGIIMSGLQQGGSPIIGYKRVV